MDSNQLVGLFCSIERCFELGRWDVVEINRPGPRPCSGPTYANATTGHRHDSCDAGTLPPPPPAPRPLNVRIRACTAACCRGRRDRRENVRYRYRRASVVIKGHAFIQNVRCGHYELGTETTPNSESRPHSTYSSQRSDERGRLPPGLFSILSNNATEPPKGREQPLVRAHMSDCWEPDPKTRAVEVDQRPVRLRTLADRPKRRHCLPQTLPAPRLWGWETFSLQQVGATNGCSTGNVFAGFGNVWCPALSTCVQSLVLCGRGRCLGVRCYHFGRRPLAGLCQPPSSPPPRRRRRLISWRSTSNWWATIAPTGSSSARRL